MHIFVKYLLCKGHYDFMLSIFLIQILIFDKLPESACLVKFNFQETFFHCKILKWRYNGAYFNVSISDRIIYGKIVVL